MVFFFFKQKTAYEMRISDWSSTCALPICWTSRGQLEAEMRADAQRRAPVVSAIAATAITDLPGQPELMQAAVQGGAAAFRVHCVQCHGAGGAGVPNLYPSLTDADWLWGGDIASIDYTIANGIRNPDQDRKIGRASCRERVGLYV